MAYYRYYIGQQAYILITDLDMLKEIMVKDFDNFSDHYVSNDKLVVEICLVYTVEPL